MKSLAKARPYRPQDWEDFMTLCIAAFCEPAKCIVFVSDLMVSSDWTSVETTTPKVEPCGPSAKWCWMFSGDTTVSARISDFLFRQEWTGTEREADVERRFREAFGAEVCRKIENEVLGVYGLTRETFLEKGRDYFGDERFTRLDYQIQDTRLDTTLLVAGFDQDFPRMFSIRDSGIVHKHERLGFHAIGTGYVHALSALYETYDSKAPLEEIVYRVCEAKFRGERASGVGKSTLLNILRSDGGHAGQPPEFIEELRKVWEPFRKTTFPDEAREMCKQIRGLTWKYR